MKILKEFFKVEVFKKVLEELYKNYPDFVWTESLSRIIDKEPGKEINGICLYLEDKGLIVGIKDEQGWRITASGIDRLEQRDLLEPEPGESNIWVIES